MQPALSGIVVADFTHYAAGPYCTMLLADLGARVIKVEQPGTGDGSRQWGTHRFGDRSLLYLACNRNKESIVADMKDPAGSEVVSRLVQRADVVVEGFNTGVADRLGIGYADVSRVNPRVIYCSVSGFGRTGPLRDRPGFDMLLQAYAGPMGVTGEPGRPPVRMGPGAIDLMTGAFAFGAITTALLVREKTGEGQYLEASLYDTAVNLMNYSIPEYFATGYSQEPTGGTHPHISPYGVFSAQDGYFFLGVGNDRHFLRFTEAIGMPKLPEDPRFRTNPLRVANRAPLTAILEELFATGPIDRWVQIAEECGVPASRVNNVERVVNDPHAVEREAIVSVPGLPSIKVPGAPFRFSRTPPTVQGEPPTLGRDTAEVRRWLGFDDNG